MVSSESPEPVVLTAGGERQVVTVAQNEGVGTDVAGCGDWLTGAGAVVCGDWLTGAGAATGVGVRKKFAVA